MNENAPFSAYGSTPEPTDPAPAPAPLPAAPARSENPRRRWSWQRFGGKFLVLSILAHVVFLAIAGYLVVQTYQAHKKPEFKASSQGPNASEHSLEHAIKQKKQKSGGSPPSAKRVTVSNTTSKVALPSMPAMPTMSAAPLAASISGMGMGNGFGNGNGSGFGGGAGGGGGGGGGLSFFGARDAVGLKGTFFDLKQSFSRQDTNMNGQAYAKAVTDFNSGGWNPTFFYKYFRGPDPLYAAHVFIPSIPADQGPAAFKLEKLVKPSYWLVHYKGKVSPPENGTYHFVGAGDDVCMVKFNGKLVLARNWDNPYVGVVQTGWRSEANYKYDNWATFPQGIGKGQGLQLDASQFYDIEILIGEQPGGYAAAGVLVEKEGADYHRNGAGEPILPIFQVARVPLPPEGNYMPHMSVEESPVWKIQMPQKEKSIFDR